MKNACASLFGAADCSEIRTLDLLPVLGREKIVKETNLFVTFFHQHNVLSILYLQIFLIIFPLSAYSEILLEKETLSYNKCLEVIKTTSEKLSVEPLVEGEDEIFRKASFKMSDGVLSIICDAENNELKVLKE